MPGRADADRVPTPLEAAFTATSATTVTGLGVVETPTFWTGFGQAVILGLIKVGGLGVMTFTALLGLLVLRRLDLAQRLDTAASTRAPGLGDLRSVLATVVGFSALVETLVAAALTLRFLLGYGMGPGQALWNGVFPAVSAFNNAGFALFSTTLMGFVGDPFVCLPIAAAIVSGGLGLPVVAALRRHVRRPERWSLTVRLVLVGTAVLFSIVLAEVRGQGAVHAFGRRLSRSTHREAITVVLLSVLVMVTATAMLMGLSAFSTDQLAFEAVSAFATVGLSTGITAQLPPAGQAVLMVLMLLGRVGPATVAGPARPWPCSAWAASAAASPSS